MTKAEARRQAQAAFASRISKCAAPNCQRLTTGRWCNKHRAPAPAAGWAIADAVRREKLERDK